jgi:hypothetical protein
MLFQILDLLEAKCAGFQLRVTVDLMLFETREIIVRAITSFNIALKRFQFGVVGPQMSVIIGLRMADFPANWAHSILIESNPQMRVFIVILHRCSRHEK